MRIAIASADGKTVHQHFGHATHFQIYEVMAGQAALVTIRENAPSCGPEERPAAHQRTLDLIADCEAVVVACVGPHALRLMEARGIACFESEDLITNVLAELARRSDSKALDTQH